MPGSYRRVCGAVGGACLALALCISGASAQRAEKAAKPTEKATNEASKTQPLAITIPGGVELKESPAAQVSEATREQREKDDLVAQQLAAKAALAQAVLSFFGLVGLGFTVHFARKAWRESVTATRAAVAAAQAAQQSAQVDLAASRPWLTVGVEFSGPLVFKGDKGFVSIRVLAKNIGQYPALWVTTHVCVIPNGDAAAAAEILKHFLTWEPFPRTLFPKEPLSQDIGCQFSIKGVNPEDGLSAIIVAAVQYRLTATGDVRQTPVVLRLFPKDPQMHPKGQYLLPINQGDIPAAKLARAHFHTGYFAPT